MSNSLDMSLEDIIRNKGRSEGHSRDSRRNPRGSASSSGSGPGPDRRGPTRNPLRSNPYPVAPMQMHMPVQPAWPGQLVPSGGSEMGSKLLVSNLDYGVSNEDIKVLFSEVGNLKRCSINYDKSGRSKGTAEVVFYNHMDAVAAIKRYNNVQLDGKPMTIELVGASLVMSAPVPAPPAKSGFVRKPNVVPPRSDQQRNGGWQRVHGGSGGGPNGAGAGAGRGSVKGRGQGGGRGQKLSAEDLDAELDNYHLEATQIK
ncbi:hypothetical protein CCACVL1_25250 [Corchorus capsularis]|uniref:RRM domain-containing protein n=1 Tax=Corchorus capsularis TaxID=210143 RepID=A0A1R3GLC7_COCAP|nr:hypothetical protein CCACVL1_25250 [Corchorus capsularis]